MAELLTAAQMRAVEQAAIESGSVTGLELMERAGASVVEAILEEWPEMREGVHRAVALCGPGNNGGDGFVVARLLKKRGWDVAVFFYGRADTLPPDARANYDRWRELGDVVPISDITEVSNSSPELVVDALFGTGLTRPIEDCCDVFLDLNRETLRARRFSLPTCRLTSVDIASGLCSDSGRVLEPSPSTNDAPRLRPTHLTSQLTVTFHRMKVGHVLANGPRACGKVVVKDIGLND